MASDRSNDELDGLFEGLLWIMAVAYAALVLHDAFFFIPCAASIALLAAMRWRGEDWVLLRFGWLMTILFGSLGAAAVGLLAAWLNGQYG
jgi:hypothetical protein